MKNQLDKIIYFVKNTGDKVIVLKDDSEFVIMPLDDYEGLFHHKKQLAAMSEEEMLARINREIALWRESQRALDDLAKEEDYKNDNYENDDYQEFVPSSRLRDNDFYYNHLNKAGDEDHWVEPDWLEDLADEEDDGGFDLEEEFDLPPELSEEGDEDESLANKKGTEDISLPWKNEKPAKETKPAKEQPVIMPQKKINNFGYPNPSDTADSAQERGYGEDYGHIPPPPDR